MLQDDFMWWENLLFLDALCREGTMAAAARVLGVDKATISRRIALLEQSAPTPLFERHCGTLELTPYGERALAVYLEHERARRRLAAELELPGCDVEGSVRLTAPTFATSLLVTPALGGFLAQHPKIAVRIESTNRMLDLTRDEADVALRNVRPDFGSLCVRKIGTLGLSAYASECYLAAHGEPRSAADLAAHALLCHGSNFLEPAGLGDHCRALRPARVTYRASDALALRQAARAHLGIAVLPQALGDEASDLRRLASLGEAALDILVITRSEQRQVPRIRTVVEFLVELVRDNQHRLHAPV